MSNRQKEKKRTQGRLTLLRLGCSLFLLVAFALPGTPRQAQIPHAQNIIKAESDLVVVDVTVRDRKGNLVGDLKKEEFKIYEDNVPQDIVTFAAENIPIGPSTAAATPAAAPTTATPPTTAAAPPPEPAKPAVVNLGLNPDEPPKKEDLQNKRLVILFFDLSSLSAEDLIRSVDTARDFVTKQAGPQDLLAVATYSSTLQLVQDLTNDRDLMLKVLNGVSSTDSGDSTATDLSDTDTSDDVFVPDTGQFNIFNTDRRLSALETLAKMYRSFPEVKSLLYFSSGVSTTGVENNAQIRSTVDNANRSNMKIYPVDSRGLQALPPGGGANQASAGGRAMFSGAAATRQRTTLSSSQETMTTLAHDTGGKEFADSNNLSLAIQQVQADTQIYYVIGYFSTNAKDDGRYRRIRVEVTRPDLKLEHRPGYFASKAWNQLNQQERDLQLQQALNMDHPFDEVPLIMQADYFRKDDKTSYVPVSVELAGDGVKFDDKGANRQARFEFLAQVTDPKGKVSGVARDQLQVTIPAERAEKLKSGGIFYTTGFDLKPGEYTLKFLVRDNGTGKLGTFEEPLSVPAVDLKKLDTSSIVVGNRLANARGDAASAGVAHQGSMQRFQNMQVGYDPLVAGDKKIVPTIGNVFLNGQTVYVYFQVYGATPDPQSERPSLETYLLLFKDNTKMLESQPQLVQDWTKERSTAGFGGGRGGPGFGGRGGGDFGGRGGQGRPGGPGGGGAAMEDRKGEATVAISLPLKSLKKGTYTLQIHVRDTISDTNLFRRIPIVIQ